MTQVCIRKRAYEDIDPRGVGLVVIDALLACGIAWLVWPFASGAMKASVPPGEAIDTIATIGGAGIGIVSTVPASAFVVHRRRGNRAQGLLPERRNGNGALRDSGKRRISSSRGRSRTVYTGGRTSSQSGMPSALAAWTGQ